MKLISLNVDGVCQLLRNMKELQTSPKLDEYLSVIKQNNIIGSVLFHCDLNELKSVSCISFFSLLGQLTNT